MALYLGPVASLDFFRYLPAKRRERWTEFYPEFKGRAMELPARVEQPEKLKKIRALFPRLDSVDLLVSTPAGRTKCHGFTCSVIQQKFISGSFVQVKEGLIVCSPNLIYLLMARNLSDLEQTLLGFELCGTYSQRTDLPSGFSSGAQLATRSQIDRYISRFEAANEIPNNFGLARAKDALQQVIDSSNSPMETSLALLLTLPTRRGGYGFAMAPELNAQIRLNARARKIFENPTIRPDLYWPTHQVAVEYDSNSNHRENASISLDSKRRITLDCMGIDVFTATASNFSCADEFDKLARPLMNKLGIRKRKISAPTLRKREELISCLRKPFQIG